MKLDWEINEFRVLKAKVGEVTYYVAPGVIDLWRPHKQHTAFDGKVATVWPIEGGMSLTNAIAWCERDAERPEGCPAQPPATDPVAPKMSSGMSGPVSKFPGTMGAEEWAVGFAGDMLHWSLHPHADDRPAQERYAEWFQAALSHGFREGQASVYELVDRAQRQRDLYGPVVPGTQAPEPSSVEEQIENLAWGLKNEMKRAAERDNEIAERLGACEARLTQFVASKCQELDLRINGRLKKLEAKSCE